MVEVTQMISSSVEHYCARGPSSAGCMFGHHRIKSSRPIGYGPDGLDPTTLVSWARRTGDDLARLSEADRLDSSHSMLRDLIVFLGHLTRLPGTDALIVLLGQALQAPALPPSLGECVARSNLREAAAKLRSIADWWDEFLV